MIPYHKIYNTGKEIEYLNDSINRGQVSGDGYYTKLVQDFIRHRFNAGKAFMTTSATHALEMAMLLIGLKPGDEVVMPSFTFSSTANAVILRGAKPVFAEIDESTINIDPSDMEKRITKNTKAIIPVHYAGVCCEMDRIMEVAEKAGIYVVEDAAQAVNSKYRGKYSGSIGHMGCYSFHGTKNYTCGEGGALLINTDNPSLLERADCIRQKGTDRSRFLRGEVDSYSWVDTGSSYSPSDALMAILYAQLEYMDEITQKRRHIHEYYMDLMKKYIDKQVVKVMKIPDGCESNYHIFYLMFKDEAIRNSVKNKLIAQGIIALTHFVPLHSSPMGQGLGYKQGDLKKTEMAGRCLLRLPLYADLSEDDMHFVGERLADILEGL
jgi:dTDP-4-amino-4,6-dideoxygalactose transaminase